MGKCFTSFPAVGWHSLVNEKQEADSVSNMLQVSACGVMSIVLYFLFIVLIHEWPPMRSWVGFHSQSKYHLSKSLNTGFQLKDALRAD